jgi:diaminohydroxyphosphoribosylaminopyrimidine deaminase/5-amino-6-(5-phosphoribosylamino)uracil reductase
MATGESQWISSEASRRDVHRLRARSSAIITGVGTLLADDPSMTVRLANADLPGLREDDAIPQPLRVVVDSSLRTPATARMLALPGETVIACLPGINRGRADALRAAGARVEEFPEDRGRVKLDALLRWLADQEVNEVLMEAGPTLGGTALTCGLVDELVLYVAPHLMGDEARGLFQLPGLTRMEHRIPLVIDEVRRIGPDLRLRLRAARL